MQELREATLNIESEDQFRKRFPAVVAIPVQWGEQDGFGHVNNAVFIRWFESARIEYINLIGVELTIEGVGPILAAVDCNFRQQVKYPDTILSGARISKIGRSSIGIQHAIWSSQLSRIAADGDSTVVLFDYHGQASHPIPDDTRQRIFRLQPELQADKDSE